MGRGLVGMALLLCACEARLGGVPDANTGGGDGSVDAPIDALVLGPWGTPARVEVASTNAGEDDATLSSNGLEMVFAIGRADGTKDLLYTTRPSPTGAWTAPVALPFNVDAISDETPRFASDDLSLYFGSGRAGGLGNLDIWRVTRPTIGGAWGSPTLVAGPNSAALEKWFMPCAVDSSYLVIVGANLAEGTLPGAPVDSAILSSSDNETGSFLSGDCLTTYFASVRSGTNKIYSARRTSLTTAWTAPTEFTEFATLGGAQEDPWVSRDGRTFVFVSNVAGSKDVYISTR